MSDEAGEVGVPEVLGENFTGEGNGVLDDEADAIFFPADHVFELGALSGGRRTYRIS